MWSYCLLFVKCVCVFQVGDDREKECRCMCVRPRELRGVNVLFARTTCTKDIDFRVKMSRCFVLFGQ